ncbi:hypothetical protein PCO86_22390 (plasmid) [Pectobacteriaceae bacterium CE70]|nr:hypothetical protein [Prodigiosinella sp. LS101]WJV60598.1 hypothetical protein PCO84_22890 [Pectobacteriaceae bacterium C111]WJV64867.1 hypothetical protein PCO87_23030 [Pectobacteriaceae bacterium C52]WJV69202.1 hypothetical protein PCO86_22390 [Pectobacteriaceae bacterium CE70]WJY13129.1 hypothetical protein PCO80_22200 [Pectobacteriaceae bacterium C80]WJY17422.1 hypothetical protein PCO82_22750 [Pectobacteriaceae bacterium CE90]
MSILDLFVSLTTYQKVFLLEVFIFILLAVVIKIYFRFGDKSETQRDEPLYDALADDETRSTLHRYQAVITGKALHLMMNEAYFDAILFGFLRSLQREGYTLSSAEGLESLLPGDTFNRIALEVERTRLDYLTTLDYDIDEDIALHMQSGHSQKFLARFIDSCSKLGWKIVPLIQQSEDECVDSFSVSP